MKFLFAAFLVTFFSILNFAQQPKKWKDISLEDFQKKIDDYGAVVLLEEGNYYFDVLESDLRLFTEIRRRILITDTNELIKLSTINILFKGRKFYEYLTDFKAFAYILENNNIKKVKLQFKNKIHKDFDEDNILFIAKFPNLKLPAIIEYRYTLATYDMVEPPVWYFQNEYPVLYSSVTFTYPNFFEYLIKTNDSTNLKIEKQSKYKTLSFNYKYSDPIPSGLNYRRKSYNSNVVLNVPVNEVKIISFNNYPLPSVKYIDNINNYRKKIDFKLTYIDYKTNFSNYYEQYIWERITNNIYYIANSDNPYGEYMQNVFFNLKAGYIAFRVGTWDDFNAKMLSNENFYKKLNKTYKFITILDTLLSETETELAKAIKIYNFVRDNLQWDSVYSVFSYNNLEKAFKNQKINSAEINMILYILLKNAGFDVYPVVLKTITAGHLDEDWPSARQFNHMIVLLKIDNKNIFLDAHIKENPWYTLPIVDLNGKGKIIATYNNDFIEIKPFAETIKILDFNFENIDLQANLVKCLVNIEFTGYFSKKEFFDRLINNFEESEIKKSSLKAENSTLKGKIEIESNNFTEEGKFYPFTYIENIDFLEDKQREIPLFIEFPQKIIYRIRLKNDYFNKLKINEETINTKNFAYSTKISSSDDKTIIEIIFDFKNNFYLQKEYYMIQRIYKNYIEKINYYIDLQ